MKMIRIRRLACIALILIQGMGPVTAAVLTERGVEAEISSRQSSALASARTYHQQVGDLESSKLLVRALLQAGRNEEALTQAETLVSNANNDAQAHLLHARALSARIQDVGLFKKMSLAPKIGKAIEAALALEPELLEAHLAAVQFYLAAPSALGGGVDRAKAHVPAIERLHRVRGLVARASIQKAEDDIEAAKATLGMAVRESDGADIAARLAVGLALVDGELFTEAKTFFKDWATKEPEHAAPLYQIGRISALAGLDPAEGTEALTGYISRQLVRSEFDPSIASAYWRRGQIKLRQGDSAGARLDYELALRIDPNDPRVRAAIDDL